MTYCEEYGIWLTLFRACYNPKSPDYKNFGANGLYLCNDWLNFSTFKHTAYFKGDKDLARYILEVSLNYPPHKDKRPKRIVPTSVCLRKLPLDYYKKKQEEELRKSEINKKELLKYQEETRAIEERKNLLNGYCIRFYNYVNHLDYAFGDAWLMSFDDPNKLKFLLKYSKKNHTTIPVDDKEYYINFVNHFYYDPQFNKVYDNWVNRQDGRVAPALDHIHPKSKGGSNDLSNLRFITNIENSFKGIILPDEWEFIKHNLDKYFI